MIKDKKTTHNKIGATSNNSSNKKKLNLSVDEKLIKTSKFIALKNDTSVSELFEDYIRAIDKNPQLIQMIKDSVK